MRTLSQEIKYALQSNNAKDVFIQCIKILDWGQVYRGSVSWVLERYENGTLVDDIRYAVQILDGDEWPASNGFIDGSIRMDSGLTKIYSLASEHSIIYDDRVGGALAFLAREYLSSHEIKEVPPELQFMRGRDKSRNPSRGTLIFPGRPVRGKEDEPLFPQHAYSNLLANWLVAELVDRLGSAWSARKVEAALFMIGYQVG